MPLPGLALGFTCFRLPRHGHAADECQDAAAADPERGRYAMADGASESAFAGTWARLLVESFVAAGNGVEGMPWLGQAQERFAAVVRRAPGEPEPPWYLETGLRQGAFATFLGVVLDGGGWRALAVGDSCLFQVRQDCLVQAFPVEHSHDFGATPWLIGSRPAPGVEGRAQGVCRGGDRRSGDHLLLMTDALAQWFLSEFEAGRRPWQTLGQVRAGGLAAFAAWVNDQRSLRRLRNDDVTLLTVNL
jgi:hypothetical protein